MRGQANCANSLSTFSAVTSVPLKCVMMSPGFTPAFWAGLPGITRFTRHGKTAGLGTASGLGGVPKYPLG